MGLKARCTARHRRRTSEGEATLEAGELVFRGEFRLSIPLAEVRAVTAQRGLLGVRWPGGTASFVLGDQAERWAGAIRTPKPLIDKLGVKPGSKVAVLGVEDAAFWEQLLARTGEVTRDEPGQERDLIFLAASGREQLVRLVPLQRHLKRNGAIWVVRPKGRPEITEADVMQAGKDAGLVDTKVVAFSPTHTAEKLVIPVSRR